MGLLILHRQQCNDEDLDGNDVVGVCGGGDGDGDCDGDVSSDDGGDGDGGGGDGSLLIQLQ